MFLHFFKIAWRNLDRDRQFTFLNVFGLTIGLSFALLIFLWVNDEWQVDKFHEKDSRLYQVMQKYPTPEGIEVVDWTPALLAQALKEEVPGVESAVPVKSGAFNNGIVSYDQTHFRADGKLAGADFFEIFSYPLIQGLKNKVLSDKYAVVISEDMALKLFGTTKDVVGKTVEWKKTGFYDYIDRFTISGVFEDAPAASSERFDLVFNSDYYLQKDSPGSYSWGNNPVATYVVAEKDADIAALGEKITGLIQDRDDRVENEFFLERYSRRYLYGRYENGVQAGGRIEYIRLFSFIAAIILLIAGINFMNLSTARAARRTKEIGVKKTLGARRKDLILQFVFESLFLAFIALFLSIIFISFLLPSFNEITGKQLTLDADIRILGPFISIAFITGLISSSYPALYLSGFRPVEVLKGRLDTSFPEAWTRRGLVVFQFAVSAFLIVTVLAIYRQMNLIQSKNLGYDRDNIVRLAREGQLKDKLESFLQAIKKIPGVLNATHSNVELIGNNNFSGIVDWEGKTSEDYLLVNVFETNYDFIETFGIKIKKGRSFSREYGTDTSRIILNEAAVKGMGLSDPVGKTITFWGKQMQIAGVTDDFQYQSLHHDVEPCLFKLFAEGENYGDEIWIKLESGKELAAVGQIMETYKIFNPDYPFEYSFIEDDYQALYESEHKVAKIAKYFTVLVILISCLGLFGLAAFTAQKRQKEIGIRKIAGASTSDIAMLLSTDFLKLVLIAIGIAFPLAWYGIKRWLDDFAYHIDISWWMFALAGSLAVTAAFLTVSFQSLKAAMANPVDALRDE